MSVTGHLTTEQIGEIIKKAKLVITIRSKWVHYKDKNGERPYEVVDIVAREADFTPLVIYRPVGKDVRTARPLSQVPNGPKENCWLDKVAFEGSTVPRFRRIE